MFFLLSTILRKITKGKNNVFIQKSQHKKKEGEEGEKKAAGNAKTIKLIKLNAKAKAEKIKDTTQHTHKLLYNKIYLSSYKNYYLNHYFSLSDYCEISYVE